MYIRLILKGDFEKKIEFWQAPYLGADFMGSTTRIQKLFSLRQVQEVEQTLGVLTFCVVSLVILQTRNNEQHSTDLTKLHFFYKPNIYTVREMYKIKSQPWYIQKSKVSYIWLYVWKVSGKCGPSEELELVQELHEYLDWASAYFYHDFVVTITSKQNLLLRKYKIC